MKKKYIAVVVNGLYNGPEKNLSAIELSYILVFANSDHDACSEAKKIAIGNEISYIGVSGFVNQWKFIGFNDIQLVADQELENGSEVYGYTVSDVDENSVSDYVVGEEKYTINASVSPQPRSPKNPSVEQEKPSEPKP